ncbi:MAG TPA: hypothetical protein VL120_08505 [Solirubrobacteraceae bacterium]|nr:hypothetical protein [Solirubrobacteraceae bacterium]
MSSLYASVSAIATTAASSAGGASARDLGIAGGVSGFAIIVLLMGGLGHRSEMVTTLTWFERFSERVSGQPAWASLPCGLAIISLLTAVFGLYWDVSLHVDRGRDPGVFSNPSHIFILAGLYGIFAAGWFSICLSREERADRPGPTAIRITRDWYAPLGGLMMCGAGLFSLLGFPLDDFWHRLFGQDVTLWGPTHLMLIGGAAMTLVGIAIIQVEVRRAVRSSGLPDREYGWVRHLRHVWLPGGLLVGMSTFQGEFDWGVPQFQLIYHPMLIMLAAGVTLVAARVWLGPGRALGAVAFFIAMRGILALLVHDSLGQSLPHFPLYIAEALIVEGVAFVVAVKRPLLFGAVCGALIGTVGLAAEWGWTHVWMPIPWPREMLAETIVFGLAMAVAASLIGAWMGSRLGSERIPHSIPLRWAAVASSVAVAAMLAFPLFTQSGTDLSARVALRTVDAGPKRTAIATVTLSPRNGADHAKWLTATAWQGGGLITDRLRRVSEGVYETTRPVPLYGDWKTMIRLHKGNAILGLPIYAPADPAIPLPGVAAPPRFDRPFFSDHELLQREARTQAAWITWGAYLTVLVCTLGLLAMLAWGIHRIGVTAGRRRLPHPGVAGPPPPREPEPEPDPEFDTSLPEPVWPAHFPTYAGR